MIYCCLDDTVCIQEPHDKRRQRLQSLLHRTPGRVDIGSREVIDQHGISKENILYLNCYSYFEQVLFANSIPEVDIGLDCKQQLQPAELFKYLFSVELISTGFDKQADTIYFVLRFLQLLKIL